MRLPLTQWRLLLLAALVLLAGAMGGGSALGHPATTPRAAGCHDKGGCDLTAPAQPALIQATLRIDGKAMAGGDGNAAILPGSIGLPAFALPVRSGQGSDTVMGPRKVANGPGQPRGPPALA